MPVRFYVYIVYILASRSRSNFEETPSARVAFEREHQIKAWSRTKKIHLIESVNAGWRDLAKDWFESG
jgi:predicted GIY-YIG superfamily endonuclease